MTETQDSGGYGFWYPPVNLDGAVFEAARASSPWCHGHPAHDTLYLKNIAWKAMAPRIMGWKPMALQNHGLEGHATSWAYHVHVGSEDARRGSRALQGTG